MTNQKSKVPLFLAVLVILAILGYLLTMRGPSGSLTDAVRGISQGVDKVEQKLDINTPEQKPNDATKGTGNETNESPTSGPSPTP